MKNAPQSSASAHQRRGSRTAGARRAAGADDSIINLRSRFSRAPWIGAVAGGYTARRETGRPRAAQFAPRPVYYTG